MKWVLYDVVPTLDNVVSESSVIQLTTNHLDKTDLEAIYKSVEDKAARNALEVVQRDTLVASQVVKAIKKLHRDYPDRPLHAVLIQGYDHRSKQHINKLMPELDITEHVYNAATMKILRRDPAHKVFEAKLFSPDLPIQHTLIDRALLTNLQYAALAVKKGGVKPAYATATKTLAAPNVKLWLKVVDKTETLDDTQVHAALLKELEHYRLKGIDKIVIPAIRLLLRLSGKGKLMPRV
jgi:hypothetical protein